MKTIAFHALLVYFTFWLISLLFSPFERRLIIKVWVMWRSRTPHSSFQFSRRSSMSFYMPVGGTDLQSERFGAMAK